MTSSAKFLSISALLFLVLLTAVLTSSDGTEIGEQVGKLAGRSIFCFGIAWFLSRNGAEKKKLISFVGACICVLALTASDLNQQHQRSSFFSKMDSYLKERQDILTAEIQGNDNKVTAIALPTYDWSAIKPANTEGELFEKLKPLIEISQQYTLHFVYEHKKKMSDVGWEGALEPGNLKSLKDVGLLKKKIREMQEFYRYYDESVVNFSKDYTKAVATLSANYSKLMPSFNDSYKKSLERHEKYIQIQQETLSVADEIADHLGKAYRLNKLMVDQQKNMFLFDGSESVAKYNELADKFDLLLKRENDLVADNLQAIEKTRSKISGSK